MGLDAVDRTMLVEKKGNCTLDFVYIFKIVYTEILDQAIAQRLIQLYLALLSRQKQM